MAEHAVADVVLGAESAGVVVEPVDADVVEQGARADEAGVDFIRKRGVSDPGPAAKDSAPSPKS